MKYLLLLVLNIVFLNFSYAEDVFRANAPIKDSTIASSPSKEVQVPSYKNQEQIQNEMKMQMEKFKNTSPNPTSQTPENGFSEVKQLPPNVIALEEWKKKQKPKTKQEERKEYLLYLKRNYEFDSLGCIREVENMKKRKTPQKQIDNSFWGKCYKDYESKVKPIDEELRSIK